MNVHIDEPSPNTPAGESLEPSPGAPSTALSSSAPLLPHLRVSAPDAGIHRRSTLLNAALDELDLIGDRIADAIGLR